MKKTNFILSAAIIAFLFTIQSCTVAKISGRGAVPIVLNQPSEKMQLVEHIIIKKNRNFDWTSSFYISEVIGKKIAEKQPDALINATISIQTSVDNFFINLVTFGLARSRKIVFEADVMREIK